MTSIRFLHTSDWQLGMTRRFLFGEAQSRYSAARIEVVRRIAEVARREACDAVIVAGDVFDANLLSSQTVRRSLEALRDFPCPVFLLPGNHDALDATSLYAGSLFAEACPQGVVALRDPGRLLIAPGVELVAAPLSSNRPLVDLVAAAVDDLEADGTLRIVIGHGQVDVLSPADDNPAVLRLTAMEDALAAGAIHYVALGDRHSRTEVGGSGRIFYSGSPEVTDARDTAAGDVLVVDLDDAGRCEVRAHAVGTWRFCDVIRQLDTRADLEALDEEFARFPDKERTVVRTAFTGTLTLADKARLDEMITRYADLFAALYPWDRHTDLAVVVDDGELTDLGVGGFVAGAMGELVEGAAHGDGTARDALSLLYRLAGGGRS